MPTAELSDTSEFSAGVVSTEAIETLTARSLVHPRPKRRPRKARVRGASTVFLQVFLTTLPLVVGDLAVVLGCFYGAMMTCSLLTGTLARSGLMFQGVAVALIYVAIAFRSGLLPASGLSPVLEFRRVVISGGLSFLTIVVVNALIATLSTFEAAVGILGGSLAAVILPFNRALVRHFSAKFSWWGERCLIVGAGPQGQAIYRFFLRSPQRGIRPIGMVDRWQRGEDLEKPLNSTVSYLGSVERTSRIVRRHSVRWGIVPSTGCEGMDVASVMQYCGDIQNILVVPSQFMIPSLWSVNRECAGMMGVHVRDYLRNPVIAALKRSADVVGAFVGLIFAAPIFVLAVLLIRLKSPGPVFYGQDRVGLNGKIFTAWKFRTMVLNADDVLDEYLEADPVMRQEWIKFQKLQNDPRVIEGVGSFLRRSSLDELPQLWNVLRGDMSLVGPRPCMASQTNLYREVFPLYKRVRPGITGLWQVSGRNLTSYAHRVKLDAYYVTNWSIWLDAYILMRTAKTILFREGAF